MDLKRRELMAGSLAMAALPSTVQASGTTAASYFRSKDNPLVNADEMDLQPRLLSLWANPKIKAARDQAAFLWKTAYGVDVPEEAWPGFESAMDEYAFNYLIKAVISDGNYPRILRNFMPAGEWLGKQVPGARIGGDNPDNCYRMVGIAPDGRYRLRVRTVGTPPSSTTFTLMANYGTSKTIQTISAETAQRESDGSFTILIDGDPANDRTNHLRSNEDAKILFIRDSLGDWTTQTPHAVQIERLNPPTRDPLSDEEVVARAAKIMTDDVPLYYWFVRLCTGKPLDQLIDPAGSGRLGGLVSQAGSQGRLQLGDDDATIVRLDPAGAAYVDFVLHDNWFRTIDYWKVQSSLTNGQMKADPDGTYTIVVALRDPGVHNWVDPAGLRNVLTVTRWQGLLSGDGARQPRLSSQKVKLASLRDHLPSTTEWMTPDARKAQLAERVAGFQRRITP